MTTPRRNTRRPLSSVRSGMQSNGRAKSAPPEAMKSCGISELRFMCVCAIAVPGLVVATVVTTAVMTVGRTDVTTAVRTVVTTSVTTAVTVYRLRQLLR